MIAPANKFIVHPESRWKDRKEIGGGKVLYLDVVTEPTWSVSISAEVVASPEVIFPKQGTYIDREYSVGARPGDKLYFHFNTIHEDNYLLLNGRECYVLDFDKAFCYERDGVLHMLSDWCLVSPIEEKEDLGILTNPYTRRKDGCGVLRHKGADCQMDIDGGSVEPGDVVFFPSNFEFENEIAGEVYYCVRARFINAALKRGE